MLQARPHMAGAPGTPAASLPTAPSTPGAQPPSEPPQPSGSGPLRPRLTRDVTACGGLCTHVLSGVPGFSLVSLEARVAFGALQGRTWSGGAGPRVWGGCCGPGPLGRAGLWGDCQSAGAPRPAPGGAPRDGDAGGGASVTAGLRGQCVCTCVSVRTCVCLCTRVCLLRCGSDVLERARVLQGPTERTGVYSRLSREDPCCPDSPAGKAGQSRQALTWRGGHEGQSQPRSPCVPDWPKGVSGGTHGEAGEALGAVSGGAVFTLGEQTASGHCGPHPGRPLLDSGVPGSPPTRAVPCALRHSPFRPSARGLRGVLGALRLLRGPKEGKVKWTPGSEPHRLRGARPLGGKRDN